MVPTAFLESTPTPFDFGSTAQAHGWVMLRPFAWDKQTANLSRIQRLSSGQIVRLQMQAGNDEHSSHIAVQVTSAHPLTPEEEIEARQDVRRMLRLDEDFSGFYRLVDLLPGWQLHLAPGGGRLLRCPTLFEDIVYTLCTTNINWTGTIRMVARLVEKLGESFPGQPEWQAFPTPEAIVTAGPEFLKQETGLGYRSDYVWHLARQVAEGELDLATYDDRAKTVDEVYREVRQLKGVGDYAAATILMLLGRYERLAIDSELRAFTTKKYFGGESGIDAQIRELYAPWGDWKYLAYWFDRG